MILMFLMLFGLTKFQAPAQKEAMLWCHIKTVGRGTDIDGRESGSKRHHVMVITLMFQKAHVGTAARMYFVLIISDFFFLIFS
jgi:hypothetical protein